MTQSWLTIWLGAWSNLTEGGDLNLATPVMTHHIICRAWTVTWRLCIWVIWGRMREMKDCSIFVCALWQGLKWTSLQTIIKPDTSLVTFLYFSIEHSKFTRSFFHPYFILSWLSFYCKIVSTWFYWWSWFYSFLLLRMALTIFNYSKERVVIQHEMIFYSPNYNRPIDISLQPNYSFHPFKQPCLNASMFKQPVWWVVLKYGEVTRPGIIPDALTNWAI